MKKYHLVLSESGAVPTDRRTAERRIMQVGSSVDAGYYSLTEKFDWMEIIRIITQSRYDANNLKGYMEWKKFLDFLAD